MTLISFNFEVHQPHRLNKNVKLDEKNLWNRYIDDKLNKEIFNRVSEKCYIPANRLILDLIDEYNIKVSYSITGVFIEQACAYNDEVIDLFKDLVNTKNVELIGETYHHSISSLFKDHNEFREDILLHKELIKELFNYDTKFFRNTELIYNNKIAKTVKEMGFKGIFTEGADRILGWRSPNYVYSSTCDLKVLLRNYQLSDDIGFRFSCVNWEEYPLTADKYALWLANTPGDCINIYVDYETFGEHQWKETGIFEFLKYLPIEIEKYSNLEYATPSEIVDRFEPKGLIDVHELSTISWADTERDVSAWLGNKMQLHSLNKLMILRNQLGNFVKNQYSNNKPISIENTFNIAATNKPQNNKILDKISTPLTELPENLRKYYNILEYRIYKNLQTSDNFYYQCTKGFNDMDVHSYFSHFNTPYDAFVCYMDVVYDFKEYLILTDIKNKYEKGIRQLRSKLDQCIKEKENIIERMEKLQNDYEHSNNEIDKLNSLLEHLNKEEIILKNKIMELTKKNKELILKMEELKKKFIFKENKNLLNAKIGVNEDVGNNIDSSSNEIVENNRNNKNKNINNIKSKNNTVNNTNTNNIYNNNVNNKVKNNKNEIIVNNENKNDKNNKKKNKNNFKGNYIIGS